MNKEIGERIKAIRISKKLYPKDVGAEIGMLQTSYSKIERGGNTTIETLLKIAKVLGVSAAVFFDDTQMVAEPTQKIGFVDNSRFESLERVVEQLVKRFDEEFPKKKPAKTTYMSKNKKSSGK